MDHTIGLIQAEVAKLAAEHSRRVTREEAALAGQLAADVVEAFLSLGRSERALAAKNRGPIARGIIAWLLAADLPKNARRSAKPANWDAEDWAGPVAGPTVIEREHGISRSTLHKWQRDGHVIALAKGRKKHAFPLRQFVDGRPVPRIKEIVERIGNARDAWVWMCADHPKLGQAPIECLRRGDEKSVVLVMP